MNRVTSLTALSEQELDRWIKRIGLILLVAAIAFVAFYALDRFRLPAAPIVDRELAALEEAVRADPADITARGRLADVYLVARRYDDAIAQYTAILDAGKEIELASLGRARALWEAGRLDEAATDYQKVVEIALTGEMANVDPNLEAAYYGLGVIALAQDRPTDAVDALAKAVRIIRTDADALNALGAAYLRVDDPAEAIVVLSRAVALVPVGWSEPYASLAEAYAQVGNPGLAEWAGAMVAFQEGDIAGAETRLLALASGDQALEASVGLGVLMESKGDTVAAAEWYTKALTIDPENMPARLGMSRVRGPAPAGATTAPSTGGSN